MKISASKHSNQLWKAHQLLDGFRVEDEWSLPIELHANSSIKEVQDTFVLAISQIGTKGMAGFLFRFRNWLGRVFNWEDDMVHSSTRPAGLLKSRYAKLINVSPEELPSEGFQNFDLVYQLQEESLLEIENKTVQAAIHFCKVKTAEGYCADMAIYVKPNGLFGQLYMLAIKPFRHWIVYPTLLKALGKAWNATK